MTAIYSRPDGKNRFQIASASERPLFSTWLDQEFNTIFGVLNGLQISGEINASEWTTISGTFTQVSSTVFTVPDNLTSVFEPLRAIQFTDGSEVTTESHIQSSSYDSGTNTTTIVVYDAVVPSTISKVGVGIVSTSSATIPSVQVETKTANYTVGDKDQILLVDDSLSYTGTKLFDDDSEIVEGDTNGYYVTLITLPQASVLPNKLLCVKKIAGNYQTVVLSHYIHSIAHEGGEDINKYTYDFQIKGDTLAKNRVELKGVGDCVWFVSNGVDWYEITPESSETVKGIVRLATESEMTLTAQQLADGETLRRDLAVSPYQLDKEYMRTDASNMSFATNYIYTAPNGVAELTDSTHLLVHEGVGLNIPTGRDAYQVCTSKRYELIQNLEYPAVSGDVSNKLKLMFVKSDSTLQPILSKNYYMGYVQPTITNTISGEFIMWFDFGANLLKYSTDNGTNWATFDGAGPICEFNGDGTNFDFLKSYEPVAFLTRDELQNIYQQAFLNQKVDYNAGVSLNEGNSVPTDGILLIYRNYTQFQTWYVTIDSVIVLRDQSFDGTGEYRGIIPVSKGQSIDKLFGCSATFYPYYGASL